MKRTGLRMVVLVATVGAAAACSRPEEGYPATVEPDNMLGTTGDYGRLDPTQFVELSATATRAQLELAELARERAADPAVRQYATRMIREHRQALAELQQAAGGIDLPSARDRRRWLLYQQLAGLRGPEFDRAYIRAMVDAHDRFVRLVAARAERAGLEPTVGSGPPGADGRETVGSSASEHRPLSRWAASRLPQLQSDLARAKQIEQAIGARR